jgi:hypothetical protein
VQCAIEKYMNALPTNYQLHVITLLDPILLSTYLRYRRIQVDISLLRIYRADTFARNKTFSTLQLVANHFSTSFSPSDKVYL